MTHGLHTNSLHLFLPGASAKKTDLKTINAVLKAMNQSLNCMSAAGGGRMPVAPLVQGHVWEDHSLDSLDAGKPICPLYFEYTMTKGDLEFKRDAFNQVQIGRYYGKQDFMCTCCFANGIVPELAWDNFSMKAGHRKTTVSLPDYLANTPEHLQNELVKLHGYTHEMCSA